MTDSMARGSSVPGFGGAKEADTQIRRAYPLIDYDAWSRGGSPCLGPGSQSLLALIAARAGRDGACVLSTRQIAAAYGLPRRTIQRSGAALERKGLIQRQPVTDGRGHIYAIRYTLLPDAADALWRCSAANVSPAAGGVR